MRNHLALAVTFVVALSFCADSHAFGRRRRCCTPCVPSAPNMPAQVRMPCITITNIVDNQTLGTSFTVYGNFDPAQMPLGQSIQGQVKSGMTILKNWQMAAMANGTWQIDFSNVSEGTNATLEIQLFPTPNQNCQVSRTGLTISAGAGSGLTIDDPNLMGPELATKNAIPRDYRPSGTIDHAANHGPIVTLVVFNGVPLSANEGATEPHGSSGNKDNWWGAAGQNYNLSLYAGKQVSVIVKVVADGRQRSVSLNRTVSP